MLNSNSTNKAYYDNFIKKIDDLEKIIENQALLNSSSSKLNKQIPPYYSSLKILNSTKTDSLNTFLNKMIQKFLDKYVNPLIKKAGITKAITINKSKLGKKLEFNGDSGHIYNLLTDKNLYFNGKYEKTFYLRKDRKLITKNSPALCETALTILGLGGINSVTFSHEGIAKLDKIPVQQGQKLPLADGGSVSLKGKRLNISINRGYTITQIAKPNNKIDVYIKLNQNYQKERFPSGLMGYKIKSGNIPLMLKEINPSLFSIKFELPYLIPKYLEI